MVFLVADRRTVQVCRHHTHARAGKMTVGVDKSRQQCAAAQVDNLRFITDQRHDLLGGTYRFDQFTPR